MINQKRFIVNTIFTLVLFFSISIFIHELFHHLLGVSSEFSLQKNYHLEPITYENKEIGIIGSMAGPFINLLLAYIGYFLYKYGKKSLKNIGYFIGVTNAFLIISSAFINLIVDLMSGSMGNDLEVVSSLLGWNIFVLPIIVIILGVFPFMYFLNNCKCLFKKKYQLFLALFLGWLIAGLSLMIFDNIFKIRFKIK